MTDEQIERARALHDRAARAAEMHTWSERELVAAFSDLDSFQGYRLYGAKNLYDYAMKVHKLSEAVALSLINIARKSREVPAIKKAVVEGKISISAARKIVPVITKETASTWIELAATKSVRQVEKAVAEAKPETAVRETARFVMKDRLEVVLSLDEEAFGKLKRVMDLESQRTKSAIGQGQAVVAALDAYLEKHDPILKAERIRDRKLAKVEVYDQLKSEKLRYAKQESSISNDARAPVTGQMIENSEVVDSERTEAGKKFSVRTQQLSQCRIEPRTKLPAALKQALDLRDRGRCIFVGENGVRCPERRWIHYHHVIERAFGGEDSLENLVTVCSSHHSMIHARPIRKSHEPNSHAKGCMT